jgi:hypothetical protein
MVYVISWRRSSRVHVWEYHEDVWGSRGERSASRPCHFTPGTHWIRGWVGSRAGLDAVEKIKNLSTAGNRTLAVQRVVIPTGLSRHHSKYWYFAGYPNAASYNVTTFNWTYMNRRTRALCRPTWPHGTLRTTSTPPARCRRDSELGSCQLP